MDDFDLADALQQVHEGAVEIPDETPVAALSSAELAQHLDALVDAIEDDPTVVRDAARMNLLRSLVKGLKDLEPSAASRLFDLLISGLQASVRLTEQELEDPEGGDVDRMRTVLLRYTFLLHAVLMDAEIRAQKDESQASASLVKPKSTRTKKSQSSAGGKRGAKHALPADIWNWEHEKTRALDALFRCTYDLPLKRILASSTDLDTLVAMLTKPAYLMLESPSTVKQEAVRDSIFRLIAICVVQYNHGFSAHTAIMKNLQYYDFTSGAMAELVAVIAVQNDHVQLSDELLSEVAAMEFDANNTTGPKSFARFLVRLTELGPKVVLRQMVSLVQLLDSEAYAIRMGMIDVIGYMLVWLLDSESSATDVLSSPEARQKQIEAFFDMIEERYRDVSAYVRCKVLQVTARIFQCKASFAQRRTRLIDLAVSRLEDKTSNVRSNAIKALTQSLLHHPFIIDGGELPASLFETRVQDIKASMAQVAVPKGLQDQPTGAIKTESTGDGNDDALATPPATAGATDDDDDAVPADVAQQAADYLKLQLQLKYYNDALVYIGQLNEAVAVLCQLLVSKNKSEILEAMDFFVLASKYRLETAEVGVRRMLHLIWTKDGGSEEARGVRTKLIECYKALYLERYDDVPPKDNINRITRQLISLTFGATLAELTSLEELMSVLMADGQVDVDVVQRLWAVYGSSRADIPAAQRRGAIIILGMLAKASKEVVADAVDTIMHIGLGELGQTDLALARYSLVALQRLVDTRRGKGVTQAAHTRLPQDHALFQAIRAIVERPSTQMEWFSVAEQAVHAIYLLCDHPDVLCADMVKARMAAVFDPAHNPDDPPPTSFDLAQLFFMAGHVAIKQIVHMESVEAELKRRKGDEKAVAAKKSEAEEELEQMAGPTDDDVVDAMGALRERELLYGKNALLAIIAPMVVKVCKANKQYADPVLQAAATLCLSKLMCVSSDFCEEHLPLLLTILDRTTDPTIRTNAVIALGDIAVCFSAIFEQHVPYLYRRLRDPDVSVKKNTLMVLTHLILNGMVKVKGQLGEMAIALVDDDVNIRDLARLFFTELSTKDNAVYNNLPDIISHLSMGEQAVDEATFGRIMRFLFDFIKDRQSENLVDKLCQRFRGLDQPRHWRDTALCLSLLPYRTERGFKKLTEGLPYYQDKLHEDTVYKHFIDIIAKARLLKSAKTDIKTAVEEFEARLKEQKDYYQSNEAAVEKAKGVRSQPVAIARVAEGQHGAGGPAAASNQEGEGEEDDLDAPVEPETATRRRALPPTAPPRKRASRRRPVISEEEEEEEEEVPQAKPSRRTGSTRQRTRAPPPPSSDEQEREEEQEEEEEIASSSPDEAPAKRGRARAPTAKTTPEPPEARRRSTRLRK